jgi:hypothetical protein
VRALAAAAKVHDLFTSCKHRFASCLDLQRLKCKTQGIEETNDKISNTALSDSPQRVTPLKQQPWLIDWLLFRWWTLKRSRQD